jgi:hypothetical protein
MYFPGDHRLRYSVRGEVRNYIVRYWSSELRAKRTKMKGVRSFTRIADFTWFAKELADCGTVSGVSGAQLHCSLLKRTKMKAIRSSTRTADFTW